MTTSDPDLASYDVILVNSSGGKDSQASLDYVVHAARDAGVLDRVIVVHADLGRVEWEGVAELAGRQAAHYGLPFRVVRNENWADLLDRIRDRGAWPDMKNRYCTSEFKTGQVRRVMTALVREHRVRLGMSENGRDGRAIRILNVMGLRAQESPKRASMVPFMRDAASSNGRRHVDQWLPIHAWKVEQVWDRIRQSGVEHHWAYDIGMPRLSCALCVFASKPALAIGIRYNPQLARDYAAAEREMGHTFRLGFSIAEYVDEVLAADESAVPMVVEDWAA